VRAALLSVFIAVGLMAGLIGLFSWSPWASEGRAHELAWVRALDEWSNAYRGPKNRACVRAFGERVGPAPTDRMQPVARAVSNWCRGSSWYGVQGSVADMHFRTALTTREAVFSRIASSLSGVRARVHCWPEEDWTPFAQDYDAVLPGEEFRGVAVVATFPARIDLSPDVCEPLRLFFRGSYTPYFNTQSYELAEAIVTLAHEAEHLRTPGASEAVVECHALQHARAVVRMAGRRPWYQKEIADLAWLVGYPQEYADYRTKACRNGGPLDLHPRSKPWP